MLKTQLRMEHQLTEKKKKEIKKSLVSLTEYLEKLEKYLKTKYDILNAETKSTNNNIDSVNSGNSNVL